MRELSRPVIVVLSGCAAMAINLLLYVAGRAADGTFRFTARGEPAAVDAVTVAGFSAVPLLVGLTVVAVLAPRFPWATPAALILGPLLAVVTIPLMTIPADFDPTSTIVLSLCHLSLVPIVVLAVRALRARPPAEVRV